MENTVDIWIAVSILVMSCFFWLSYYLTFESFVNHYIARIFLFNPKQINSTLNNKHFYWFLGTCCIIYLILDMVVRFSLADDINEALFASYRLIYKRNVSIQIRIISWFTGFVQPVVYGIMAIFFLWSFLKQKSMYRCFPMIISCIVLALWTFDIWGLGARRLMIITPIMILLLFILLIAKKELVSKKLFIILPTYLLICTFLIILSGSIRQEGIYGIYKIFQEKNKQVFLSQSFFDRTIYMPRKSKANNDQRIYEQLTNEIKVNNTINSANGDKNEQNIETSFVQLSPCLIKKEQENLFLKQNFTKQQESTIKSFIERFRPVNNSDVVAWSLKYYGYYEDHLGITVSIKSIIARFLPREFFPNGKPLGVHQIIPQKMKIKDFNWPPGLFCEGYILGGYPVAIFFCILQGIILGVIAKIITTIFLNSVEIRMDNTIFGIAFLQCFFFAGVITSTQIVPKIIFIFICVFMIMTITKFFFYISQQCDKKNKNIL
jgi:hypothetical protein